MANAAPIGRVYRMNWLFRGFGIFILLFGSFMAFAFGRDLLVGDNKPDFGMIAVAIIFPIAGAGLTAHAFVSRLAFSKDGLEQTFVRSRKRLPYASIRGRREFVVKGGNPRGSTRYLRLESNDGNPALEFGKKLYTFDAAFWKWFDTLPDLDAMDKVKHKDSNFGLV